MRTWAMGYYFGTFVEKLIFDRSKKCTYVMSYLTIFQYLHKFWALGIPTKVVNIESWKYS